MLSIYEFALLGFFRPHATVLFLYFTARVSLAPTDLGIVVQPLSAVGVKRCARLKERDSYATEGALKDFGGRRLRAVRVSRAMVARS